MSSSTRNNTFDERYAVPLEASRRGAHRARRNPLLGMLPFVLVAVVVLGVGFGAYAVFGPTKGSSTVAGADEDPGADSDASAPPVSATSSPSATSGSTSTPTATPTDAATGGTTTEADKTTAVMVLNGAGVTGLAAKVQTQLKGDDWASVDVDTAPEKTSRTTVYYGSNALEATAAQMAKDLGTERTRKSAAVAPTGITVILGSDFELAN